jgi:rod shape-determining protein MreC
MNFPLRNSYQERNRKRRLTIISIVVIFLILIFSNSFGRAILFKVGQPFWGVKNTFSAFFSDKTSLLRSKLSLIQENNDLKKQIADNSEQQSLFNLIKNENNDLKSLLNRKNESKDVLATVLLKPYFSPFDTLIIDQGSTEGISVGDKIKSGNTYIGYISEVYGNSSKAILYSSYGEKVKVLIGKNNIEKEAVGRGGGNFSIEVPRETDVKEGDPIIIPSISPNIFGVVEKIDYKENDATENILFKNDVNINELKWVLIEKQ